jgi:hypothetical protein
MGNATELKPYMQKAFAKAKARFWWSDRFGWGIAALGVLGAMVPPSAETWTWIITVLGLCMLIVQRVLLYRFRKGYACAEKIRRAFLAADAYGEKVPAATLATLTKRHGTLIQDGAPYYTSLYPPGPKRLLMLTWESAFWSEDLQEAMSAKYLNRAWLSTALFACALAGVLHWSAQAPGQASVIGRALLAVAVLLVALDFWGRWRECEDTQRECEQTGERCRALLEGKTPSGAEAWGVACDYGAASLLAYPIPDELYRGRMELLNKEWQKIVDETDAHTKATGTG